MRQRQSHPQRAYCVVRLVGDKHFAKYFMSLAEPTVGAEESDPIWFNKTVNLVKLFS